MLYCGKIMPCFYHRGKSTKGGTCMSEICIIVTIVVYLAAMLLVGFAYSKTNNDSADF